MADWDAGRYHRLSAPQVAWGRQVLERLSPRPGERILDLGCGTGRLTADVAARTENFVTALDRSGAMLAEARLGRPPGVALVQADGAALPFADAFDAVFSTATFHWIPDHDALFREIHRVLRPGGRLVAQAGGGPNLQRLLDRAHALMDSPRFGHFFQGWFDPWYFAGADETRQRLADAGFTSIDVSVEAAPTAMPDGAAFGEFISCVCVRHHVDRLPAVDRADFVEALAEEASTDEPPFTLDYWRLNLAARKEAR